MGSCIQCCCLSQGGTVCCTILSILAAFYFLIMFLIFDSQKNFFDIPLPHPDDTKISFLISMIAYIVFFGICVFRMFRMGRDKKNGSLKVSINDVKQLGSIKYEKNYNPVGSAKQLRQQE